MTTAKPTSKHGACIKHLADMVNVLNTIIENLKRFDHLRDPSQHEIDVNIYRHRYRHIDLIYEGRHDEALKLIVAYAAPKGTP
jgi:hypothetical protein